MPRSGRSEKMDALLRASSRARRDLERTGLVKRNRSSVLTLEEASAGMRALAELHRVCMAMDLDRDGGRPSEDEYQAAMAAAAEALNDWPKNRKPNAVVSGEPTDAKE